MNDSRSARELGFLELVAEDFATHDRDPFQPGFWALLAHRFGVRCAAAEKPVIRRAGAGVHQTLSALLDWSVGIDLPATVELGRRVRLWHSGCMRLHARSIGNDVHIRQATTFGPAPGAAENDPASLPVIADRADISAGACVLGAVTVGADVVVGANSVVAQDVAPRTAVLGIPARAIPLWSVGAKSATDANPRPCAGLPAGDRNENPRRIGFFALLREDLRTHDDSLLSPGFWTLAVHRFGNWRMGLGSHVARAPLTCVYRTAYRAIVAAWGIDLPYNVKVGRRLRIDGHGALFIGASAIGDDVHIRGNVTVGLRRRGVLAAPSIGNRVEIQPNACVVGNLHLGDDSVIGARAVVARDVRPGAMVLGIPGKVVDPACCFELQTPRARAVRPIAQPIVPMPIAPPPIADLAIIVLNYRTPTLALRCLESLRGEVRPGIRVVVVDNASGDGSAARIGDHVRDAGWGAWARVIESPVNGGFAAGNNFGIRAVPARAYVLLNSDTEVRPGAIAELTRALAEHPRAGIVGPSFESGDGGLENSCFRFPHPLGELVRAANTGVVTKALRRFEVPIGARETASAPDWIAFACVAIRREVIDQVGLLDEGYFMYFEDVDYCRKVRAAGWTILYWPRARVVHLMGASSRISSADDARHRRPHRYFYEARARYFATSFGIRGVWGANALWTSGRALSRLREAFGRKARHVRDNEARDIWINVWRPMAASRSAPPIRALAPGSKPARDVARRLVDVARWSDTPDAERSGGRRSQGRPSHQRLSDARSHEAAGLLELVGEDFVTHGRSVASPGFWAIAVHRVGSRATRVEPRALRAAAFAGHRLAAAAVDWIWGIRIGASVSLGRRVHIHHHGAIVLDARAIGDDVQIRHNTMLGPARGHGDTGRPIIERGVELAAGVCVLGSVTLGAGSVVDANAVVLGSCPSGARISGIHTRAETPDPAAAARSTVASQGTSTVDDHTRGSGARADGRIASVVALYPVRPPSMTSVCPVRYDGAASVR